MLKIGVYNKDNELISDSQEINFELTAENPRDREIVVSLILTKKVDNANGQGHIF